MSKINTDKLAGAIYTGAVDENNLPFPVYEHNAKKLSEAVLKGYKQGAKSVKYNSVDRKLLESLQNNIYRFSAAKTYQQTREMVGVLDKMSKALTEGERVVPFREFKTAVAEISNTYNINYLRTEYTTAIASAQSASAWARFESEKGTLPNLRYSTIGDACEICAPLDGVVFPVDSPFWDTNNVPQHFNCLCILEQEDEDFKVTGAKEMQALETRLIELKSPVFNNNVGKSGQVFNEEHPYFSAPRALVDNNFGLPIPEGAQLIPEEIGFVPAATIKAAEDYATSELGCLFADYKGMDLAVANDMNRGLYNTKVLLPELKVNGVGSIQQMNRAFTVDYLAAFKEGDFYKNLVGKGDIDFAERMALRYVKNNVSRPQSGVLAWSQRKNNLSIGQTRQSFPKYNGVFFNNTKKVTKAEIDAVVQGCEARGWFTKGANDFSYIMSHELGHEIDKWLGYKQSDEFKAIFAREHKAGLKVVGERLSNYGATAGKLVAHRPDEMIAEAWAEFTTAKEPRELAREIGVSILKSYYEQHLQGTGTTFKLFLEKSNKLIKK